MRIERGRLRSAMTVILFLALLLAASAGAECIRNRNGETVCGPGKCDTDSYGKVFCAEAGGGVLKDRYGNVQCGVGYCARDSREEVWCSKEPGGSAAIDSYGNVRCLGGCQAGSAKYCRAGQ